MNKRITSLLLCFVMVFAMLATAVPVFAAGTTSFSVTSDKTEASPGETITYTITMAPVQRLDSLKFTLKLSSGLTIVPGSGKLTPGLKETLKCVDTAWTESTKIFYVTLCDEGTGYSSENPTVLMTLQCTVDEGASGDLTADLYIDPEECYDPDYDNIAFTVTPATVTVVAAPKPATGISLNKTAATIYTGNTETLIATVEPTDTTDTVVWTSSKESVATVDNTGNEDSSCRSQHNLQETNDRVCNEKSGGKVCDGEVVLHFRSCYQSGRNRQSGLPFCPEETGGAWNLLCRPRGPAADKLRLCGVGFADRHGPGQCPQYASHFLRRPSGKDPSFGGVCWPTGPGGGRSMVHWEFRGHPERCGGGLSRAA